jgi:hypothetical protein
MNAPADTTIDASSSAIRLDAMSKLELVDRMDELLSKATALSLVTYGEQGETFRRLSDANQDIFMWTLGDMIQEIHNAWGAYFSRLTKEDRA